MHLTTVSRAAGRPLRDQQGPVRDQQGPVHGQPATPCPLQWFRSLQLP